MASGTDIAEIKAREILDSRGNPTIEVDVRLSSGVMGRAAVPSGASTGVHEALELRDGDAKRYGGKGVLKAVGNVNTQDRRCAQGLRCHPAGRPRCAADRRSTAPRTRRNLGANAMLGVSLATAHAAAASKKSPALSLPESRRAPHAGADDERAQRRQPRRLQRRHAGVHDRAGRRAHRWPTRFAWAPRFFMRSPACSKKRGQSTNVGDEGGFAPNLSSNEEPIEVILEAIAKAGYKPGADVAHRARPGLERILRTTANTSSRAPTRRRAPPTRW